ncbi:Uncharacterized protein, UPF0297 family [Alkalithermobacter thermoalcaliphilus JW-YL-7 = DSM 7308]|uniref:UPF0297 protein JWYL7_1020 n=1 Tax=Alkalithermobacter thermoalcaliphilus JW-YL-7 = DSM 7308 TaxID=1121328 RepID=A0A150FRV5_CLOPD|nr:UPF0297 protein [[Clostridium] paradoxum JW-YL-7 = DSM 7308]SHK76172.1 Uncharacterized protein, UPF0297 family [[Clostridium] paradoxum JW-YL-7 = DSM 7308]
MEKDLELTMMFESPEKEDLTPKDIILNVYHALKEKGYNPVNQLIGYILSGDPSYITSYKDARTMIRKIERDEILEEILKKYLEGK